MQLKITITAQIKTLSPVHRFGKIQSPCLTLPLAVRVDVHGCLEFPVPVSLYCKPVVGSPAARSLVCIVDTLHGTR